MAKMFHFFKNQFSKRFVHQSSNGSEYSAIAGSAVVKKKRDHYIVKNAHPKPKNDRTIPEVVEGQQVFIAVKKNDFNSYKVVECQIIQVAENKGEMMLRIKFSAGHTLERYLHGDEIGTSAEEAVNNLAYSIYL